MATKKKKIEVKVGQVWMLPYYQNGKPNGDWWKGVVVGLGSENHAVRQLNGDSKTSPNNSINPIKLMSFELGSIVEDEFLPEIKKELVIVDLPIVTYALSYNDTFWDMLYNWYCKRKKRVYSEKDIEQFEERSRLVKLMAEADSQGEEDKAIEYLKQLQKIHDV